MIEVPLNLPLDASLVNERAKADKVLAAAAIIASQFKVNFNTARGRGAAGGESDLRGGGDAGQREVIILDHAQAPHRQPDLWEDDRLRTPRPCSLKSSQPGP